MRTWEELTSTEKDMYIRKTDDMIESKVGGLSEKHTISLAKRIFFNEQKRGLTE